MIAPCLHCGSFSPDEISCPYCWRDAADGPNAEVAGGASVDASEPGSPEEHYLRNDIGGEGGGA